MKDNTAIRTEIAVSGETNAGDVIDTVYDAETDQHIAITQDMVVEAAETHRKILVAGNIATQSLWEFADNLKKMNDRKLYLALGYNSFGDYTESELNLKRRQAYAYVSVAGKIRESVRPGAHLGIKKLELLAQLPEMYQREVLTVPQIIPSTGQAKTIDEMSRRELEQVKKALKDPAQALDALEKARDRLAEIQMENGEARAEVQALESEANRLREQPSPETQKRLEELGRELDRAREKIKRYESEEQKLKEAITSLEKRLKHAEEENARGSQVLSKLLIEYESLKKAYEQLLAENKELQVQVKKEGINDPNHPLNKRKAELEREIKELEKKIEELKFDLSDQEYLVRKRAEKEAASERACKVLHRRLSVLLDAKGTIEYELRQVTEDPYGSLTRQIKKYLSVLEDITGMLKDVLTRIQNAG
jgi:DNA repair exonuclease SbcCD ATPase subunit